MKNRIIRGLSTPILAIFLLFPVVGSAREEMSQHCKKDIEKYCENVKPGEGRVWSCLREHNSNLSEECREHMEKARQGHGVCENDVKKFCKDVKPGEGRVWSCLKEHRSQLSDRCEEKISKMQAKREACEDDVNKFCSSKKGDPKKVSKCLKKHSEELSSDCKAARRN